jgi:hypothetical protein
MATLAAPPRASYEAGAMTLHIALAVAALAASVVLLFSTVGRALALAGLVASGLEVAMALGALRLHVAGVPLGLVLGLALAIPGLIAWLRAASKPAISAAAILALVGCLQVTLAVHSRL